MEDIHVIEPDSEFIKELADLGGDSVKKCFQCGTCSVTCSLSPTAKPFPRKEMLWAQWGLKDRLMKDPDVWLCHQCTDCSARCPRGARPADVLAALRSYSIRHWAPGFLGKLTSSPKYLPVVLAVPALFLIGYLWAIGNLTFPEGEISTSRFIPVIRGHIGMIVLLIFVFTVTGIGVSRFWRTIKDSVPQSSNGPSGSFGRNLIWTLVDALVHRNFGKCQTNRLSRYTHLAIFYGFVLLLLAAFLGAIYDLTGTESPYPMLGPVKIAGNLGALLLLGGSAGAIYQRVFRSNNIGKTTYSDWFLLVTLFFVAITGVATEVIRLFGLAAATYSLYLAHLWLMITLLAYAPFSKGAHMVYRTIALALARQSGRTS